MPELEFPYKLVVIKQDRGKSERLAEGGTPFARVYG
jgi:hypothetical protein